ncbi:MAG: 3-oxoadipyl-CoA thiolase [Pseudomonadota bacterium]
MREAFICDYLRTPIGRFGGALAPVRPDDLLAQVIRSLLARHPDLDPAQIGDVIVGCANQAGEDNRNIARMALLLAGLPVSVPGVTVNRLCGSGMQAVIYAAQAVAAGDMDIALAGGVESMSRAPFVTAKAPQAWSRQVETYDTTIGWRFVNPLLKAQYGVDAMPETAENVAADYDISRADQDAFALNSQQKAARAVASGRLAREITSVSVPRRKSADIVVNEDEHPRPDTSLDALSRLATPFRDPGTVTAGNASGVNDGAAALLIASGDAVKSFGLTPLARVVSSQMVGVEPRVMGIGPLPASEALLGRQGLSVDDVAVLEINEAFAAQSLAVTRGLQLDDADERVNPHGGAIALGHPLGMSGARIAGSVALDLSDGVGQHGLAAMCIGVGQGIALLLERA